MKRFSVPISILRDAGEFLDEVRRGENLQDKMVSLFWSSVVFFAIYGAIIGAYHSGLQSLSSAVKLPILYLLTSAICFPTLYILNLLFGTKQTFAQHLVLLLSALGITGLLLLSFAPITAFFMMTSAHYQFFKLMNVGILGLCAIFGVRFFFRGMMTISGSEEGEADARVRIIWLWIMLYAFVGSQLGWTLRPFFGSPDLEFEVMREIGGNFYMNIIEAIKEVFAFD
ncbi:MAG: actin-binding WH2 domain-containing protein [Armatimonadetes bacterium]|nr:actin-binding WH2 domain-containing protein [Armatimonadota bacterium]